MMVFAMPDESRNACALNAGTARAAPGDFLGFIGRAWHAAGPRTVLKCTVSDQSERDRRALAV